MGCMPWMDKSMHELAVKTMLCFALPLRLPLRQGRGVGGYIYLYISTEKFRSQYGEIIPISIHVAITTSQVNGLRHVQMI